MRVSIGIDPGISGGVVAIDAETLRVLEVADCPTVVVGTKTEFDVPAMAALLRRLARPGSQVVLEKAQAMAKHGTPQGAVSMFHYGAGYGIWLGLLGGLGIPYRTVLACQWTRRLLQGMTGDGKARSIRFAMQMFPGIELIPPRCRKPRDGRADAACLAYLGTKC